MTTEEKSIGIFGGTFDPIHLGHLRAALEIKQSLKLTEMRLIPAHNPPHRAAPSANANVRLEMVKLAVQNSPLMVDEREMMREGPSYSVDTLMSLRREFPYASLSMVVGVDAFLSITTWYQWEKLLQLSNIIVMHRAGFSLPQSGLSYELLKKHGIPENKSIHDFKQGVLVKQPITELNISASKIRDDIQKGSSPQYLIPEKIWEYIQKEEIYGYNRGLTQGLNQSEFFNSEEGKKA